ncbi:claudin-11b [Chanos chanos]|uniref:Claudin n=1 Tax=Chanos chanos TaxID=29144 RepID=A0A6J2V0N8_CHACN|nr:claudin-11-like [Chanos chanos]
MSQSCRLLFGFIVSGIGWIGIIIATATNDWVVTCKYGMHTCKKMHELEAQGLWADCVISTEIYHCIALTQILTLPAYVQTARALMIIASILGLPAMSLVLVAMPCVKLGNETADTKHKRAVLGGVLLLLMSLCGIVSTVWFPIGAHHEKGLMSFGFSLYAGWMGCVLCLLGGSIMACCSGGDPSAQLPENHFYYSKHSGAASPIPPANNHAKSAHV